MAQRKQQDLLSRLADRGEQMVGRITDLPGAKQLVDRMAGLTKGLDDVQRKLRSLDPLERRVTQLERRLEKLEGAGSAKTTTRRTTARASSAKRSTSSSAARTSAARKTPRRRSSGSS
jgi:uncharacterized protein YoxC